MFKDRLQQAMQDLGISQAQISKITGINRSSISQYVSGKNVPTESRQAEIATALGLPLDYFSCEETRAAVNAISGNGIIPRLTVTETAKLMGLSKKALSNGLQDGAFPWGYAVRGRGEKYVYFINAKRFAEIEGIAI